MAAEHTVIVPTLAVRPKELQRALASLFSQQERRVVPLVVVNGDRFDPDLLQSLRRNRNIRFYQIEVSSPVRARHEGRKYVDTPYFGFLDDDDEYLPNAIAIKRRLFESEPETDVVVGNGWRSVSRARELIWQDTGAIASDPSGALMDLNWLASCSALFRTETIGPEYFDYDFDYLEWTYLAIHLTLTRTISFAAEPTFVIHSTPGSASHSDAYMEAHSTVLSRMLEFQIPRPLRKQLRRKLTEARHNLSEYYRRRGLMDMAWRNHLLSMTAVHGFLRYGLYTRRLLRPPLPDKNE